MKNERSLKITRRAFVQCAAVALGSLITAACNAQNTDDDAPTAVVPPPMPTGAPPRPVPVVIPPAPPAPFPAQMIFVNALAANANDANPGTESRPLKTIAKAADLALANNLRDIGTQVVIYPGVYRESVSLQPKTWHANVPIQFRARENGTAIIAGSDVWTGWKRQGSMNVYTHNWPYKWGVAPIPSGWKGHVDLKPIVRRREMVFINGASLTQVLSNRDMKEGTFYVSEQSATISLMPPAGVEVESATIEVAIRSGLFTVAGGQNLTVRGLVFMHDNTPVDGTAVTFIDCTNVTVEDCKFLWNNWAGTTFLTSPPQSSRGMIARRNIANYNGAIGMAASYVKDVLYEDNETSYNNWRGALGGFNSWATAGMKHFAVHGGTYRRHRAVGNHAAGCWFDTDCTNIAIEQAFCSRNDGTGLFIEASEGPTSITDCTVCHCQTDAGILSEGATNVVLQGNIIYGNASAQIRVLKGIRPVKNWETAENLNLTAEQWTLRKNIIIGTDAAPRLVDLTNSEGANGSHFLSTLVSDENVWFSPKNGKVFDVNGKSIDFTTWQSVSKQDGGSRFIDPQFVNAEDDDFTLPPGNPLPSK